VFLVAAARARVVEMWRAFVHASRDRYDLHNIPISKSHSLSTGAPAEMVELRGRPESLAAGVAR
jgi:hypothetical protein